MGIKIISFDAYLYTYIHFCDLSNDRYRPFVLATRATSWTYENTFLHANALPVVSWSDCCSNRVNLNTFNNLKHILVLVRCYDYLMHGMHKNNNKIKYNSYLLHLANPFLFYFILIYLNIFKPNCKLVKTAYNSNRLTGIHDVTNDILFIPFEELNNRRGILFYLWLILWGNHLFVLKSALKNTEFFAIYGNQFAKRNKTRVQKFDYEIKPVVWFFQVIPSCL